MHGLYLAAEDGGSVSLAGGNLIFVAVVAVIALSALGVAGFVPDLNPDGKLFGVLPMDTIMSVLFVISGLAGIAIGMSGRRHLTPPANASSDDMRPWV